MNSIVFDKIEFKNFLSFGNTWSSFIIENGVILIQGHDVNTGKSNGSGKSSLLELLPFALYGKTIKDIKKDKIPNWINNSKCEVKLYFHINDDDYYFYRSIKPNKFIVKVNNEPIPQLSNVRDFQSKINDEVIGMNFNTFKNLVYFSPNNSISIVDAKKDIKRKFLESLFDLNEYSEMMRLCNIKINNQKTIVTKLNNDIINMRSTISSLNDDILNSVVPDMSQLKKDLSFLKLKKEGLTEDKINFDENKYNNLVDRAKDLEQDKIKYENINNNLSLKYELCIEDIGKTNIDDIIKKYNTVEQKISKTQSLLDNIDKSFDDNIIKVTHQINCVSDNIDKNQKNIDKIKSIKQNIVFNINQKKKELIELVDSDDISDKTDCPLCKQKIDFDTIEKFLVDKYSEISSEISKYGQGLIIVDKKLEYYNLINHKINDELKQLEEELKQLEQDKSDYFFLSERIKVLNESRDNIGDIDKIKSDYNKTKSNINDYKKEIEENKHKIEMTILDLDICNDSFKDIDILKKKKEKRDLDIENVDKEINDLNIRIKDMNDIYKKEVKIFNKKKLRIKEIENTIDENTKRISRSSLITDHLNYIKLSLKDENIKQYAISSLLPFLNNQTNYYLSESGFPYSVIIDGWLDIEIRGFGANNVSYQSLSGGERKSIDMSIQFACNDLAALQAKSVLNIRLYDEILDTSLDTQSLHPLLSIIRTKQQKMGSSVYVITHREDIKELIFDSYINIEKKDGFSTIKVME